MICANAGKIGFVSSGTMRPTRPALLRRKRLGRSYPRTSSAVSTAWRVDSATPGLPLSTRDTVASDTLAWSAMSRSLAFTSPPPSSHVSWTVVGRAPRPDADPGPAGAQCDSTLADLRTRSVCRCAGLDAREVSRVEDDGLVRRARHVHQCHLVERLAEVDHGVALGVHPAQASAPQRDRALARLDQAAVDRERVCVPDVLVPRHRTATVLAEGSLHADLVAVGHHRHRREGHEQADSRLDGVGADEGADPRHVVGPDEVEGVDERLPGDP